MNGLWKASICIALLVVVVLLILIYKRAASTNVSITLDTTFDQKIDELHAAVAQHVEVNAVLELLRGLKPDSDLEVKLADYSRELTNSVLWMRANVLANDLGKIDKHISSLREVQLRSSEYMRYKQPIDGFEAIRAEVQLKFDEIIKVIEQRATTTVS